MPKEIAAEWAKGDVSRKRLIQIFKDTGFDKETKSGFIGNAICINIYIYAYRKRLMRV